MKQRLRRLLTWFAHTRVGEWIIEPEYAAVIHLVFGLMWLGPGSVVTLLWLASLTAWVSWMSLYAIVVAHWSGLQAALADLRVKDSS